jgi:hypothetical protein
MASNLKKNPNLFLDWDLVAVFKDYPFNQAALKAAFEESVASSPSVSI